MTYWLSRSIQCDGTNDWCATDEDRRIVGGLTEEQAKAYQRGELDYCTGCLELTEPFCGDHCSGCEAHCRKEFGACVDCFETAHTISIDDKPRCIPHDRAWEATTPHRGGTEE